VIVLPVNHFKDRSEDGRHPDRLVQGDTVKIIEKENQGTRDESKLVEGKIVRILSKGGRYENGAKVQIVLSETDHRFKEMGLATFIGRVQYITHRVDDEENPYMKYVTQQINDLKNK